MKIFYRNRKPFGWILLTLFFLISMILPSVAQSGNQSDVTGPNPVEIVPNSNSFSGSSAQVNRSAYESQLQQASTSQAIQLLEEYHASEFCNHLKLEHCGEVPSLEQIVQTLTILWQETGKKTAFIYVSSHKDQLELLTIFPKNANGAKQNLAPEVLEKVTLRVSVSEAPRSLVLKTANQLRRNVTNVQRSSLFLSSAQQLYDWIIQPLEAELAAQNIDILVFSMDSGLRLLPIAPWYDGEQLLIEKYAVAIVPSFGLADIRYEDVRRKSILAMGASEFSNAEDLPAVELELDAIAQQPWQGQTFLNDTFTVENFLAQNSSSPFGIIHLATHGQFKPGSIENSYIQFSDRKVNLSQMRQLATQLGWTGVDHPLIELFVLSACQTAVGDEGAELGFAGLAVQLGVKSALASFWTISDVGTLALMAEYYSQLAKTPIKAEALQQAQISLLTGQVQIQGNILQLSNGKKFILPPELQTQGDMNFTHPSFWSAFTLIGNWN